MVNNPRHNKFIRILYYGRKEKLSEIKIKKRCLTKNKSTFIVPSRIS